MGDYKIFFQNHLKGLASRLMTHPRRWYHKKKAKNCKKENVVLFVITAQVELSSMI